MMTGIIKRDWWQFKLIDSTYFNSLVVDRNISTNEETSRDISEQNIAFLM
jgi:hypothetical protein